MKKILVYALPIMAGFSFFNGSSLLSIPPVISFDDIKNSLSRIAAKPYEGFKSAELEVYCEPKQGKSNQTRNKWAIILPSRNDHTTAQSLVSQFLDQGKYTYEISNPENATSLHGRAEDKHFASYRLTVYEKSKEIQYHQLGNGEKIELVNNHHLPPLRFYLEPFAPVELKWDHIKDPLKKAGENLEAPPPTVKLNGKTWTVSAYVPGLVKNLFHEIEGTKSVTHLEVAGPLDEFLGNMYSYQALPKDKDGKDIEGLPEIFFYLTLKK